MLKSSVYLILLLSFSWFATAQTRLTEISVEPAMAGFGASFVIDGDQIIIGRSGRSSMFPEPPNQKGAVLIYQKQDGAWVEAHAITPEDVTLSDAFGSDMALSGDWLAVSAPNADAECGAVYMFARDGASWKWAQRLAPAECDAPQHMGQALVFDGETLIAGAPLYGEKKGALYAFSVDEAGTWQQTAMGVNDDEPADVGYGGGSLAANEAGLFIGARGYEGKGIVYHIPREGGALNWNSSIKLAPADTTLRAFGATLAVGDHELMVGAPGLHNGPPLVGAVVVFSNSDGAWKETKTLRMDPTKVDTIDVGISVSTDVGFGFSLFMEGDELWLGELIGDGGKTTIAVFRREDAESEWKEEQYVTDAELGTASFFGQKIAVAGNLAVVDAGSADFGNGRVYVIERDAEGEMWKITHQLKDTGRSLEALTGGEIDCTDGHAAEFECSDVALLSFLPITDVGGDTGDIVNDIWGWTDPQTEREYVLLGRSFGTAFVDVTDPSNPRYLGSLPATAGSEPNAWRDIKVYDDHAFIVADGAGEHGMQVFDLTQLRDVDDVPHAFSEAAHYDGVQSAHNIVINEASGFAFIVGANGGGSTCGGGLHMVDIRDPLNPSFAGCFNDQSTEVSGRGYSHDAQCVIYTGPDEAYQGHEICFGSNETALSIADVTDKDAPVPIATVSYPNVEYAHQGWLTEDHRYFYMNDEGDELAGVTDGTRTIIWDVEELDDPVLAGVYIGETKSSDHNLYVKGNLLYESNYVSGLRILDITDPLAPHEVGFLDTMPWGANDPGFAGSWSNYPFFQSGTIAVSSIKEGLFLVKYSRREMP